MIKRIFKFKKINIERSIIISIFALIVSITNVYFQFFNKRHEVVYTTIDPIFRKNEIGIPLLLKNTGNQAEVILGCELLLEINGETIQRDMRISSTKPKGFPLLLSPEESKIIELKGNLHTYFGGTWSFDGNKNGKAAYYPITQRQNLKLQLGIRYLTTEGIEASENRLIGMVSFNDNNEEINRFECIPIQLEKINLNHNYSYISSKVIVLNHKTNGNLNHNLKDSSDLKQFNDIKDYFERNKTQK